MTSRPRSGAQEVEVAARSRRMTKGERREQLLETALRIVRERGTDALTLGVLAEQAGVSKPIAYAHFETRAGLLVAMARHIDARQLVQLHAALKQALPRLDDVARVVARAYIHCYTSVGPEWNAIVSALRGDEAMEAFQRELLDNYVRIFEASFAEVSTLTGAELHLACVAILGAADALAREMLGGRIDEAAAAEATAAFARRCLAPAAPQGAAR